MSTIAAAAERIGTRTQARISRLVGSPFFWVIALGVIFAYPIVRSLGMPVPKPLPVVTTLPLFSLTKEDGRAFGSKELAGRVWIANFIFSRCPTICPKFTETMAKVQHRTRNMGTSVHLVSFSVDPEYDTAEVLQAYAKAHRASPRRWSFLTGPNEEMKKVVIDGLKTAYGKNTDADGAELMSIFHGTHFVLVDGKGRVRGFYASDDEERVNDLVRDAGLLVNRPD